jgi:hypothetical protein
MSKQDFLANMRLARSLLENEQVATDLRIEKSADWSRRLSRVAIWLTTKSVDDFNASDFPELGKKQTELQDSVLAFRTLAKEIPFRAPATDEQLTNARAALKRILEILEPYLPVSDEGQRVEAAVRKLQFPEWIVTWDYQLGNDHDETPAVWLNVYADEESAPIKQLAQHSLRITQELRKELNEAKINRWPYVRMQSAQLQGAQ